MITAVYTKSGLDKLMPLFDQLSGFPWFGTLGYEEPVLTVTLNRELDAAERAVLDAAVAGYVSPREYMRLNHTATHYARSRSTNAGDLCTVLTMIYPSNDDNKGSVFGALKTVAELHASNVADIADDTLSFTLQLVDDTRAAVLSSACSDVTHLLDKWRAASDGDCAERRAYVSVMLEGLRYFVPNHDCVWHVRASVSNPHVRLTLHGMQHLYYDIM